MKKLKERYRNYSSISNNEAFLLSLIKTHNLTVFGTKELYALSRWQITRIHNTLFSLTKKRILTRIKRDTYTQTEKLNENIFEIATTVVIPSYISFWTALSYYGFTEQQIQTIQLISTRQAKHLRLNSHTIQTTTFQPREFYGYIRIEKFVIAEKEKTMIDSLFQLEKCGGLQEYIKCLKNSWSELKKKKLLHYLILFNNRTLISRMGYLIEHLELDDGRILDALEQNKSISPVKFNPQKPRRGCYNKKWNVIINDVIVLEEIR